jgi:hypothetical protein
MKPKWIANADGSFTLPAGKYYIGDLCYAEKLSDVWNDFCIMFFSQPHGVVAGIEFFAAGTAYGDGEYAGSNGFGFPVDAGLIGIISAKHLTAADKDKDYINVFEFKDAFKVSASAGIFYFGNIVIDTAGCDEELEDY